MGGMIGLWTLEGCDSGRKITIHKTRRVRLERGRVENLRCPGKNNAGGDGGGSGRNDDGDDEWILYVKE